MTIKLAVFTPNAVTQLTIAVMMFLTTLNGLKAVAASYPDVKSAVTDSQIVLDNGIITITIDRKSSNIVNLSFERNGQPMEIGKRGQSMYFDSNGGPKVIPPGTNMTPPKAGYMPLGAYCQSVNVVSSSPDRVEVVSKGGPTTFLPFATEVHYVMLKGLSGYYAYCIYHHGEGMPAGTVGQARFVIRGPAGPSIFTDVAIDDNRIGPIDQSPQVKTVSDATFLLVDGQVYCKYNNSAYIANHHVHGMLGHGIGLWMINPSEEYVNGGPTRQELTTHFDNTLLNMLQGGHYGAGGIEVADNEEWTKFYGPFLVYANAGPTDQEMYDDAKRQTIKEESLWPYRWVGSPDYPIDRGSVTGKLSLTDGESASGAWVVLADAGGNWPDQAKNYEYWAQAGDDGAFSIQKVRPGKYALYAYGANQFEQFEEDNIDVGPGTNTSLKTINWTPVKHGTEIWQIGKPDRSTEEFKGGEDNWGPDGMRHWANFMSYPANFPDDVTFTIGKSNEATDWNFAQWTWFCKRPYWAIDFSVPKSVAGTATLTFGIAASDPLHGRTHEVIKVNGQQVGELTLAKSGAAAYRSGGSDSLYQLQYITFPAQLLKSGQNELTLGDTDATPFPDKDQQLLGKVGAIMFDAIRLEVQN